MYLKLEKHTLSFIKPAKTSRGEYVDKPSYLLWLITDKFKVCGEAAPLSDLSIDGKVDYFSIVNQIENQFLNYEKLEELLDVWKSYPHYVLPYSVSSKKQSLLKINQKKSNFQSIIYG